MILTNTQKRKLKEATQANPSEPEGAIIIAAIDIGNTLDDVYTALQKSIDKLIDAQTLVDIINNEF